MHDLRNPFEMDTSMLGRLAALLIKDLGKSRVIFLALARGQEFVVLTVIIMVSPCIIFTKLAYH